MKSETGQKQRDIQKQVEGADKKEKPKTSGAMQAGARRYPEPPFPKVHQDKPGSEADLPVAPMYDAPFYKGSDKLKDKVALITGVTPASVGRWQSSLPVKGRTSPSCISMNLRTQMTQRLLLRRRDASAL